MAATKVDRNVDLNVNKIQGGGSVKIQGGSGSGGQLWRRMVTARSMGAMEYCQLCLVIDIVWRTDKLMCLSCHDRTYFFLELNSYQ